MEVVPRRKHENATADPSPSDHPSDEDLSLGTPVAQDDRVFVPLQDYSGFASSDYRTDAAEWRLP
jgi:hypothetical protein